MIIYVDSKATVQGDGSKDFPFTRINEAAQVAQPGDEVLVAPGVYREYIDPKNAGTEENRIVYRSEKPLGAIITGGEILNCWERYEGTVWTASIDNRIFGEYNPYTQKVEGDWYMGADYIHTGDVYLNDRSMYECDSIEACLEAKLWPFSWEPEKSIYQWYSEQKDGHTVFYANFQEKDPNLERVEISARRRCFFPTQERRNYITLFGFIITKAATTWAPPSCHQDGMIGANWSKGWIIEDCEVSNSKCCGISLGRNYDPDNEQYFFYHQVKSANQMGRESICRALSQGWYKENIGSHTIRKCHIHNCEQAGIIGRQGCIFSVIEDNHIHDINIMRQLIGAEEAGIKLHVPIDTIIRRNRIHHCAMGIWLDWVAQGSRVSQNLLYDNVAPEGTKRTAYCQDIFIEASHGPTLIDNNIMLSKYSLRIAAQGVACVHNLMCGSFTAVGGGTDQLVNNKNQPRYFSYHYPHSTNLIGFMTCLHGDNRIYNNIFVQLYPVASEDKKIHTEVMGFRAKDNDSVGNFVWDEYPTYEEWISNYDFSKRPDMKDMVKMSLLHFSKLPVWIEGNAYFNGALPYEKELNNFSGETVEIELIESDGECRLKTNLYDLLGDFSGRMIDSNILGKAFEPEARFENPDASGIVFDVDYAGEKRTGSLIPGPFASAEGLKKSVW